MDKWPKLANECSLMCSGVIAINTYWIDLIWKWIRFKVAEPQENISCHRKLSLGWIKTKTKRTKRSRHQANCMDFLGSCWKKKCGEATENCVLKENQWMWRNGWARRRRSEHKHIFHRIHTNTAIVTVAVFILCSAMMRILLKSVDHNRTLVNPSPFLLHLILIHTR